MPTLSSVDRVLRLAVFTIPLGAVTTSDPFMLLRIPDRSDLALRGGSDLLCKIDQLILVSYRLFGGAYFFLLSDS